MTNRFSPRRMLAVAAVAAGLAVGGGVYAYAAGDDPAPQQDYVTIVDEPSQGPDGRDCPDKDGSGSGTEDGQGSQNEQSGDPQEQA